MKFSSVFIGFLYQRKCQRLSASCRKPVYHDSGTDRQCCQTYQLLCICNKLAWPIPPLFLAFLIGKEVTDITVADLFLPFYVIIAAFIALGIIAYMAPLPEVKAVGEDDSEEAAEACPYAAKKTSIWQFPHLLLGCLALFLYVGVETVSLGTLVDYATSLHLENAAMYADCSDSIVIGYICGIIFILNI